MSTVIVHGSATPAAEHLDAAVAISLEHVHRSRDEPGCLAHAVHRDVENANRLVFVERWASMAALMAHIAVPASRAFGKALAAMCGDRLRMTVYQAGEVPLDAAKAASPAVAPAVASITDENPTVAEMEARVARFAALVPTADYADAAIPGCERTTWRVIGDPAAAPLAAESFHLNLVRCAPGRAAPLHSHLMQEVFLVLDGTWEVFWGPDGERAVRLGPHDTISVPPGLSRGFRNVGDADALLVGIAAGRDPGRIAWPEPVRAAARAAGVELPSG